MPKGKLLRFWIEREHMRDGKRASSCSCPAALALQQKFPDSIVSVSGGVVHIDSVRYEADPKLRNWISQYDQGHRVEPDFFFLEQRGWGVPLRAF